MLVIPLVKVKQQL